MDKGFWMLLASLAVTCVCGAAEPTELKERGFSDLQPDANPDSIIFHEEIFNLMEGELRDRKRYRDAVTALIENKQIKERADNLRATKAIAEEEWENAEADFKVAQAEVDLLKSTDALREIELKVARIQEHHHLGQKIDLGELKDGVHQRWQVKLELARLTMVRHEAEMKRQDARLKRHKKLHGREVETDEQFVSIKAARYLALHEKSLTESRIKLMEKIVASYAKSR